MMTHDATRRWLVAGLVAVLCLASVGGAIAQAPAAETPPKVAAERATDQATQCSSFRAPAAGEAE
jgi:hypothetical protein